jgi:hypothetical protein
VETKARTAYPRHQRAVTIRLMDKEVPPQPASRRLPSTSRSQNTNRPVLGCTAVITQVLKPPPKPQGLLRRHPALLHLLVQVGRELRVLTRPMLPRLKHLGIELLPLRADRETRVVRSPALSHHRPRRVQLLLPRVNKKELTNLIRMGRSRALYPSCRLERSIELCI